MYGLNKNKILGKAVAFSFLMLLTVPFFSVSAKKNITDWYIQDFQSKIVVNPDSSLTVTEQITADCANLRGKHGIFRVLPTSINLTDGESISTPVKLLSITDFSGKKYKYSTSKNFFNNTVTWKIGDPDREVFGVNHYLIKYQVQNAIRTQNPDFDELYWNLNGNFWDLETEKFSAQIIFPDGVNENNSQVKYYTGKVGSQSRDLANYFWNSDGSLGFVSTKALFPRQGITASITFPKGLVTPYTPSFWTKYAWLVIILFPLLSLIVCFYMWRKFGRDSKMEKTIIPEFEIPEKLTPMEMGSLEKQGGYNYNSLAATVVDLAVKGYISIQETQEKKIFGILDQKEIKFELKKEDTSGLSGSQRIVLEALFSRGLTQKSALFSNVKKNISKDQNFFTDLSEAVQEEIFQKGLITKKGLTLKKIFLAIAVSLVVLGILLISFLGNLFLALSGIFSGIIFLIFSFLMPRWTLKGAEIDWKIKGFKLYMKTAEKYRQQFNEKENIFEKFLPYAILFGMTKLWIAKMKKIYGEDYFSSYQPIWYAGFIGNNFDVGDFASRINSISADINSVVTSSSGSGGGGFSGGGGGGGGGGGW